MHVVRVRPGVVLGDLDLFNHCGVGELWCNDWVGVIQIYWPFDVDQFEYVTSVNAGGRDGNQLIVVTEHLHVRLESSPSWAGGRLLDDGKTICFWWRCLLRQGQFRKLATPAVRNREDEIIDLQTNRPSAMPGGGNASSAAR